MDAELDLLEGDVELTEFTEIEVKSIKGVKQGANGFPVLLMKGLAGKAVTAEEEQAGVPAWEHRPFDGTHAHEHPDGGGGRHSHQHAHKSDAAHGHAHPAGKSAAGHAAAAVAKAVTDGQVDEGPDVDLGRQIMGLLARAIQAEAAEIEAGAYGETCDVRTLVRAADMVAAWTNREQGGCGCCADCTGPGCGCCWDCPSAVMQSAWEYAADDVAKAPREFSAGERKKHAKEGNALPDGSYPVPDADALRRAAILARSGHGDVAAAKKLIARRAKELGVANPLDDDKSDAGKSAVAEGETGVQTDAQETGSLSKAVEDALAKAIGPLKERLEAFGADLAKVMAAPVPGGPVLSAARPQAASGGDDWAAKAAYYRQKAELVTDPVDRDGYRQLAREASEKAQAATA